MPKPGNHKFMLLSVFWVSCSFVHNVISTLKENGRSNFIEIFPQITEADPETLHVDTVVCMTTTQW